MTAGLEFAILAVTGTVLIFIYQPSAADAWANSGVVNHALTFGGIVRAAHRVVAAAFFLTLAIMAVIHLLLAFGRAWRSRRRSLWAAAVVLTWIAGFMASFTGYLLPWDQLALSSVTVGTNMMGFLPIFNRSLHIQYVLIGNSSISPGTVRFWFFVHVIAVPTLIVGLGLAMLLGLRRRTPLEPASPDAARSMFG